MLQRVKSSNLIPTAGPIVARRPMPNTAHSALKCDYVNENTAFTKGGSWVRLNKKANSRNLKTDLPLPLLLLDKLLRHPKATFSKKTSIFFYF